MFEQVYYDDKQEKYFIFAGLTIGDIDTQMEDAESAGEFDMDDLNYIGTKEQILEQLLPMLQNEEE